MLETQLAGLQTDTMGRIESAATPSDLELIRVEVLGRKGTLAAISKDMGKIAAEERARIGKLLNEAKSVLEAALNARQEQFAALALSERLEQV